MTSESFPTTQVVSLPNIVTFEFKHYLVVVEEHRQILYSLT